MHACARSLHDAVNASTPVERNFLQLVWVQKLGWGRRFLWLVLFSQKKKKKEKKYCTCTVEIPTEIEFTGTFQTYLQCANRSACQRKNRSGPGHEMGVSFAAVLTVIIRL